MRPQAEACEAVAGTHAVHRQRKIVVGREGLARNEIHDRRLQARQRVRQADHRLAQAQLVAQQDHQLLQRENLRPAELVALPGRVVVLQGTQHRGDHVLDPDRRQPGLGAGQRQRQRNRLQQVGHLGQERVALAEDHGRLEDGPLQVGTALVAHDPFRLALAAQVVARPVVRIGLEPAHVQQPVHPRLAAGGHHLPGKLAVRAPEAGAAAARLVVDAHEVGHRIVAAERRRKLRRVVDVAAHDLYGRQHPQVPGAFRSGRQDGRAMPCAGKGCAEVGADESVSAEQADVAGSHGGIIGADGGWRMADGGWRMVGGWWLVVGGQWPVVGGRWPVVSGKWLVVGGWWVSTHECSCQKESRRTVREDPPAAIDCRGRLAQRFPAIRQPLTTNH